MQKTLLEDLRYFFLNKIELKINSIFEFRLTIKNINRNQFFHIEMKI